MPEIKELNRLMEKGVEAKIFPGAVLLVQRSGKLKHLSAHGHTSITPKGSAVETSTIFDLASLTKILATTSVIMDAISRSELNLSDRVVDYLSEFGGDKKDSITLVDLLQHSSGLIAWRPYFHEVAAAAGGSLVGTKAGRDAVRAMVAAEIPQVERGVRAEYSDLGFILLDWVLETACGKPLNELFDARIATKLDLDDLFFVDLKERHKLETARKSDRFAATEKCAWRGRTLLGEVHDDNCSVMGGVSGHAGLFGCAQDIAHLAQTWLDAYSGKASLFETDLVRRFWMRSEVPKSERALGFDTKSSAESQAGTAIGPKTIGHLGFTGTSLWIDPEAELIVVLLSNRVHPSRDNESIKEFRPGLHDLVVAKLA